MGRNGKEPIFNYMHELAAHTDKNNRIKLHRILDYVKYLRKEGAKAKEPYVKHLDGKIWELRPIRVRQYVVTSQLQLVDLSVY